MDFGISEKPVLSVPLMLPMFTFPSPKAKHKMTSITTSLVNKLTGICGLVFPTKKMKASGLVMTVTQLLGSTGEKMNQITMILVNIGWKWTLQLNPNSVNGTIGSSLPIKPKDLTTPTRIKSSVLLFSPKTAKKMCWQKSWNPMKMQYFTRFRR